MWWSCDQWYTCKSADIELWWNWNKRQSLNEPVCNTSNGCCGQWRGCAHVNGVKHCRVGVHIQHAAYDVAWHWRSGATRQRSHCWWPGCHWNTQKIQKTGTEVVCASCSNWCTAQLQWCDNDIDNKKDGVQRPQNIGNMPVIHFPTYHTYTPTSISSCIANLMPWVRTLTFSQNMIHIQQKMLNLILMVYGFFAFDDDGRWRHSKKLSITWNTQNITVIFICHKASWHIYIYTKTI